MGLESALYAAVFGVAVGSLTSLLLGMPRLLDAGVARLDLPTRLVTSLGAGIYEELLFRVILTGGLLALLHGAFALRRGVAAPLAVLLSALIFSAFHYVGSLGDTFTIQSFVFRAVAGLAFSGLYVTRGLGITAWTHALYDIGITLLQS
jgi:membrane protease YdiL (CAAX protease family)